MMEVAELQADPEFQALDPAVQERIIQRIIPAASAAYKGAPDEPLANADVTDKTASTALRYGLPIAGAVLGPAGVLGGAAVAGAGGVAGSALGDAAESNPVDWGKAAISGGINAAAIPAARVAGAALGTGLAKTGLKRVTGDIDMTNVGNVARDVTQNIAPGKSRSVAETILDILGRQGNRLPINAPGAKASAELVRKQIPYKQPGGKELYGAMRQGAEQVPAYDKLLQQYRSMHALGGVPSWREIAAMGLAGGSGYMGGGLPGGLAALLLPRLFQAGRFAPKAPMVQGATGGLSGYLNDSME